MPDLEIYTGAYGFDIVIDTNIDLTTADIIKLKIKSPAGVTSSRDLTNLNVSDGLEGEVTYTVLSSDFTSPGLYKVQVNDESGGTKKIISDIIKVRVRPSLEYVGP